MLRGRWVSSWRTFLAHSLRAPFSAWTQGAFVGGAAGFNFLQVERTSGLHVRGARLDDFGGYLCNSSGQTSGKDLGGARALGGTESYVETASWFRIVGGGAVTKGDPVARPALPPVL